MEESGRSQRRPGALSPRREAGSQSGLLPRLEITRFCGLGESGAAGSLPRIAEGLRELPGLGQQRRERGAFATEIPRFPDGESTGRADS